MILVGLMPFPMMVFLAGCGIALAGLLSIIIALVFWPQEFRD